jgi:2',3'-cyclic-nucleotide 2'-phosphodiesterase (5'-nucleotidase family)
LYPLLFSSLSFLGISAIWPRISPSAPSIKVAFIGDQGLNSESKKVLQLIKAEQAEIVLDQGDFDYANNPEAWQQQINDILGPAFPYFSTLGNHEEEKITEYVRKISERNKRIPELTCTGKCWP